MQYLTGFHAIEEKIKSGDEVGPLLVAKSGPRAKLIISMAQEAKIRIDKVGTHELDRIASDHRGIALAVEDQSSSKEISVKNFVEGLGDKTDSLVVILDEITDPHNFGAILRSCDQFGVDLVVTRNKRTAKHADVVSKTSAGASAWIPSAETANLHRAIEELKEAGFWIYGADMDGEIAYEMKLKGRIAVIMGSEGSGLGRLLRESCDGMISIPSCGKVDSLNVSVAAGILLYEIRRQRAGK
jgi:23S rRNA (guanosine2251-2'-O)-methyltransferase